MWEATRATSLRALESTEDDVASNAARGHDPPAYCFASRPGNSNHLIAIIRSNFSAETIGRSFAPNPFGSFSSTYPAAAS
jgi:hypothetical protein